MRVVEARGGSFGAMMDGAKSAGKSNHELQGTRYDVIARTLRNDTRAAENKDALAGVSVADFSHRLFDARWLAAQNATYELIAVVNRLDREPMSDGECGESRLVYRLAYDADVKGTRVASRLPMTLVVALRESSRDLQSGCRTVANRWRASESLSGGALGEWLVSATGPLGHGGLSPARVSRVEVNLQLVRWPSTVRPDLGGHAEYLMRVFDVTPSGFALAKLANTPDLARLRRDRALRNELRTWLSDPAHLRQVDAGTVELPDEFLADKAVSVAPRGLARRANRPYRQLFVASDFETLDFSEARVAGSPEAFLRRLDDLTCQGCHQSRSIAGFHLLGEEGPDAALGNALASGASVHLEAEVARRRRLNDELAQGARGDFSRPFAARDAAAPGGYGAHCGLGDSGFAAWTCGSGFACEPYDAPTDDDAVGICLPERAQVGDPCEVARVKPHEDPHRDRARGAQARPCANGAVCNTNRVGFPGGMCTESCGDLSSEGRCGAIAVLRGFNDCLGQGKPFTQCLSEHTKPAGLRACDVEHPCRDDYICARAADGQGACIPPYFLFQLRVDGHPSPN